MGMLKCVGQWRIMAWGFKYLKGKEECKSCWLEVELKRLSCKISLCLRLFGKLGVSNCIGAKLYFSFGTMSTSNTEQSELQNGTSGPQAPASDSDPNPTESKDISIQSNDEPPADSEASKPDESKDGSTQLTQVQPTNEEELNPGDKPIQSDVAPVVDVDSDPKIDEPESNNARELRKDEGSRTFTMRELLNELKNGDGNEDSEADRRDPGTPYRSVFECDSYLSLY
ncbi:unnamed protein product [Ilex paraguariensis]|uniref:Uncharacterized protein n=1 Tax=Ilex paraguariensis TaxID=185542 RepID=A0ABC8TMM0_9AQUA